jgi:hypothetical protein
VYNLGKFQVYPTKPRGFDVVTNGNAIGLFWYANGCIYATASNSTSMMASEIELTDQIEICKWIETEYKTIVNKDQ